MVFLNRVVIAANVVILIWNGWLLLRCRKLLKQLKRDTQIVGAYANFFEERAREAGYNEPILIPDELEGEGV